MKLNKNMKIYIEDKRLNNNSNKESGITLIALIITIIILLILAGVALASLSGENGLLNKSSQAKEKAIKAQYEEELNLTIASMRTDSIYKNEEFNMSYIIKKLPEYLESENKKDYEWDEEQNLEEPIGEYKEYTFYIDKEYVAHIEDKEKHQIPLEGLKNRWNLGVENSDFKINRGTPQYKGEQEGVYLNNTVLCTKENYNLNETYTIVFENKNIETNGLGALVGFGQGGAYWGGKFLGCALYNKTNLFYARNGAGDNYCVTMENNEENYAKDVWHVFAIKNDETEFSFFVDNKKIGTTSASAIKLSPLYIGGFSNIGSSAGVNWSYANGYYRNLAIYDRALTDTELQNFSF